MDVDAERQRSLLDRLEAYLARRDGVDKVLKVTRYTCKLLLASSLARKNPSIIASRLKDFEASVGTSRKAFRLGKFLQNVNALLKVPSLLSLPGMLELVANGGEGIYYFVEQFIWLIKAGLLDKRHSKRLQKISAWAEFIGYFGSVTLKCMQITALLQQEATLAHSLQTEEQNVQRGCTLEAARKLVDLRRKRFLKTLSTIQDLADTLLALSDIRDGRVALANPFLLSSCGLLSALISSHKNWASC